MEQKEFLDVLSINEARERLNSYLTLEPGVEKVELSNALGRIIAEDIIADVDVPPFDRAAMDGYALRASDTFYADEEKPVELRLAGYIPAGSRKSLDVEKGRCAGIATGAPIPKGANSVVMVEFTERIDRIVRIYRPVAPGENIMAAGADIMRGETALRKEMLISLREMGVLAALGIKNVNVYKKPKVAIFSTGDEIVEPGRKLAFGEIFDANANAIAGAVAENGGVPVFL
ncbi:MAG: molybdopterin biosynthesis protein, partial [Candidatus Hydrothermarchaeaceae archaeon]